MERTGVEARTAPVTRGPVYHVYRPSWVIIALCVSVVGCAAPFKTAAPGRGAPHISRLEFIPDRIRFGCPLRIRFRFDDSQGDIVRAVAHWTWEQMKSRETRSATLDVELEAFAGRTSGEVNTMLTFERHGRYWIRVQVEDTLGHQSNILKGVILVDAPFPWGKTRSCE